MTSDLSDAEDLAQETFLQAMQSWHRFNQQSRVETWLYSILLNLDRKRKRSYVRRWRRITTWFARQSSTADADYSVEANESNSQLWNAVRQLPAVQRQTIILRFAEGLSYAEVGAVMACPTGTVKSRLHNGLTSLKKTLRDYESADLASPSCCGEKL